MTMLNPMTQKILRNKAFRNTLKLILSLSMKEPQSTSIPTLIPLCWYMDSKKQRTGQREIRIKRADEGFSVMIKVTTWVVFRNEM